MSVRDRVFKPFRLKQWSFVLITGEAVGNLVARGGTAFYDAVAYAADMLDRCHLLSAHTPKWVVALTDGADGGSKRGSVKTACTRLQKENMNIAVITIGNEVNQSVVGQFISAATQGRQANPARLLLYALR